MYVIIGFINAFLPLLLVFLLWRLLIGILRSVLNQGSRRQMPEKENATQVEVPDLAAEIERKLKLKKKAAVVTDRDLKIYNEAAPAPAAEQTCTTIKETREQTAAKPRFTHEMLVNGFIMGEVLGRPRSLKPYDEDF